MASSKITKTPQEIRNDFKEDLQVGFRQLGLNVNVSDASVYGPLSHGIANIISPIYYDLDVLTDQMMPDTALGEYLDRITEAVGLARKMPSASYSSFVHKTLAPSNFIAAGAELISAESIRFVVLSTGNYSDGDLIDVISTSTGEEANITAGTSLKWTNPPAQSSDPVLAIDAIGGSDLESDEELRERYFSFIANPPTSGNSSQVAATAEEFSSAIEKAYVYPAIAPGVVSIALTAKQQSEAGNYSRRVPNNIVNDCYAYVQGILPEAVRYFVQPTIDIPSSVAISINIPNARGSSSSTNAAIGSGWTDVKPFPRASETVIPKVAALNPNFIEMQCIPGDAPIVNTTSISWIHKGLVKTGRVVYAVEVGAGSGLWRIGLDIPYINIMEVGDYVFPTCVNAQGYVDTIIASFAELGPGEITDSPGLLPRSLRKPYQTESNPSSISYAFLRNLYNNHDEVDDAEFLFRQYGSSQPIPPPPSVYTPGIFTVGKIGVYPK